MVQLRLLDGSLAQLVRAFDSHSKGRWFESIRVHWCRFCHKQEVFLSSIRIIAVPPGEAPEWVREAWVGIELPLAEKQPEHYDEEYVQMGVLSGDPENVDGFAVKGVDAIQLLEVYNSDAASWWRENTPWVLFVGDLIFKKDSCELVD